MMDNILASIIIGTCASVSLPQLAQAQPSGSVTVSVTTNDVWDLAGSQSVQFSVSNRKNTVSVGFPVTFSQNGAGAFSGPGIDTPVTLTVDGADANFSGTSKVTGTITSNNGKGHVLLTFGAHGMTVALGKTRLVGASQTLSFHFNDTEPTVTGVQTDIAAAAGKGIISNHQAISEALSSVFTGNGSWTLALSDLTTTGKKVTGTATVTLNSGQPAFNFNVNGIFKSKSDTSTLTLTAAEKDTRGSSLVVLMSGTNTVTSIKGSISGQFVKVSL
jgi:hypothetical protein